MRVGSYARGEGEGVAVVVEGVRMALEENSRANVRLRPVLYGPLDEIHATWRKYSPKLFDLSGDGDFGAEAEIV